MKRVLQIMGALVISFATAAATAERRSDAVVAVETLEGFFEAFSVEHYPNPEIHKWITDDFLILKWVRPLIGRASVLFWTPRVTQIG